MSMARARAKIGMDGSADAAPVKIWELLALGVLLGGYLITIAAVGDQGTFLVNLGGPAVFGAILLMGAIPAAMRNADMVWSPLFWFRIATAAYFSFGNVITYFLNPTSKKVIENFFSAYEDSIAKLNAVITLGVLLTLLGALVTYRLTSRARTAKALAPDASAIRSPRRLLVVGSVFLAVGGFVKLVFVVPAALGVTGTTLLGSVGALALLADAGIYLIAVWAWKVRPGLAILPIGLTLVEVAFGLLEFDKTEVIASIMVIALAWLSRGVTLRRMAVASAVIIFTFSQIVPFVTSSRTELFRRYHSLQGANITERWQIASDYFQGPGKANAEEETGLMRFSYVNGGSLALSLYDNGQPGNTMATLPAIFVPRALWPDKPNMTSIGREFNYIADGNDDSASSPGWFAEAYWDFGWIGLPILMLPLGVILEVWSALSLAILREGHWVYFPFCLLGMKIGTSVDGFIVPDVMGTACLALVAYAAMRMVLQTNRRINASASRAVSAYV